ncbi:MAG: diaminopimelate decarboxylase, partial [Candidatus Acidiferrum sp.]
KIEKNDQPGILQFNIESEAELKILLEESSKAASRSHNSPPGLSIRVNPDVKAGGHPHISTGRQHHKFGLSWPHARALYLAHKDSKFIRWQGISAHIGSQITDLAPFRSALQRLGSYLTDLRKNGIALDYLDFGGGLGVRYTNEKPISRGAYARMVAKIVRPLGVQLLLEPGRSIIAPACVLLSSVIASKRNSTKSFVILDAAMNDLIRPVLYDAPHPITKVTRAHNYKIKPRQRVDVVGPICETGDCFLENWPLDEVYPGDLVAIWATGAYGIVQSSNYNARPRPPEILINKRRSTLIRRRETRRDLLSTDILA